MAKPPDALLLLGRGGLGSAAKNELQALLQACQQGAPGLPMQLAFVDRNQPALPEALDSLCAALAPADLARQTIVIQPVMVPDEPALRRWLQKVAMRWLASQAKDARPQLVFAQPLLQSDGLVPALLNNLALATSQPDVVAEEGDEGWQTDPVAWSTVPAHQRHVLWCMGPRCVAKGAAALWPRLSQAVQASAPLKQQLQLLQTSCQYPCNQGPLMIVYPDGVWYGNLDEDSLVPVLKSHIEGSEACAAHRVHSPRVPPPCSDPDP
ncbi:MULTISPECIES: (2Fe-2S) ferredoxin domain-containing protein [Comamonas]|uniref:Cobalamin biosynthesis protein CbiX n=1 Tax=Comamonas squillarum TaxID=2977320 RepID=A0ABY6A4Y4_9BURK|nr:(2Fe-2S) ferredoxin domain-containing protein [Comamonas sp. PR12]UXC19381.1 cobalamin biosynthesis protein CbiX [Comamonas sp. PR12]